VSCVDLGCKNEAVCTIFWPGQESVMCKLHAQRAVKIADVMGFVVSMRPLPGWKANMEKEDAERKETP